MTTPDGQRYLDALEEGLEAGSVKVHVTLGEGTLFGIGGETLWATPYESADTFVIDNIPFFTDSPTFGDVVRAHREPNTRAGFYEFDEVVVKADWVWVAAIFEIPLEDALSAVRTEFPSKDELRVEGGMNGMLAMVVKPAKEAALAVFLDGLKAAGKVAIHTEEDDDDV